MDDEVKRKLGLAAAWCGPLFVIFYTIFWGVMGHNIPPPNMMALTPEMMISDYYASIRTILPSA